MDILLVIDMQEEYVGERRNKRINSYDTERLIPAVNNRIAAYPKEQVIYVTNRFLWEISRKPKRLVQGLIVVNDSLYCRKHRFCFTNEDLLSELYRVGATRIEVVGVDGNYCVGKSALDGVEKGFQIIWNQEGVGISKKKKFAKMKKRLNQAGVVGIM